MKPVYYYTFEGTNRELETAIGSVGDYMASEHTKIRDTESVKAISMTSIYRFLNQFTTLAVSFRE